MAHVRTTALQILKYLPTLFIAVFVVGGVALAQTYVGPTVPSPGGNIAPPVITNNITQIKNGSISASSIGTNNGYVLTSSGSWGNSVWAIRPSFSGSSNADSLATLMVQRLCISGTCINDLKALAAPVDIYLNSKSCNGGWCKPDSATLNEICTYNGYTHVVGVVTGGNYNNQTICSYSSGNGQWACSGGCQDSCGHLAATRVTCDDNS